METLVLDVTIAMLVDSMMMPVFGALSDKLGRRSVYLFGTAAMALFSYPFFLMLGSGSAAWVLLAFVIGNGLCHAAMVGVQPAMFSELFSAKVRYSGLAMAHEVSSLIVGLAPLIATALFSHYRSPGPVALLLVVICGISGLALSIGRAPQPVASRRYPIPDLDR